MRALRAWFASWLDVGDLVGLLGLGLLGSGLYQVFGAGWTQLGLGLLLVGLYLWRELRPGRARGRT